MQASSSRGRLNLVSGEPRNCAYGAKSFWRNPLSFSAVIGVFAGLASASVRLRRKRSSRSRFVKDVVSWLRKWVLSRNGQGSRAAPGPSVPGRVRSAPSRWKSVWSVQVRTRMRCRLPDGRAARTSLRCRAVPGEWTDVCGFCQPPELARCVEDSLGHRQKDQSCHHELWLHLDLVSNRYAHESRGNHDQRVLLKEWSCLHPPTKEKGRYDDESDHSLSSLSSVRELNASISSGYDASRTSNRERMRPEQAGCVLFFS